MPPESTFPEWWNWELSFTAHAELRMEQRGVTEIERAAGYDSSVVEGRFMIHAIYNNDPWIEVSK